GPGEILPIDQHHDRAVLLADGGRFPVHRRARYRQQSALLRNRQRWVLTLDQRATFGSPPDQVRGFRAKKSFSTFSWPICRYRTSTCASLAPPSAAPPPSKTRAAPSSSCFFQL